MCDHRQWDEPNGLQCANDNCDGHSHIYKPASGLSNETAEDQ